jgi:peptidoglycan/xylan/chitin deacetylase (PgdA/CDA1 family)
MKPDGEPDMRAARIARGLYYGGLRLLGVTARRRRHQDGGLILCYHNVVTRAEAGEGDPSLHMPRDRFAQQLHWLVTHYDVVPLVEFIHRVETGATLRSIAAITFDDGYTGVFEHAVPVLDALGLPATVFVVAGAPERLDGFWWDQPEVVTSLTPHRRQAWLNDLRGDQAAILSDCRAPSTFRIPSTHRPADWATIRAHVGRRLDIGMHSATHRCLTTLDTPDLEKELVESRAVLHRATGVWPECFAFPYGIWDRRVRDAVRAAGYRAAVTLDDRFAGRPADMWALPRLNVPAGISAAAFEAWTAGVRGGRRSKPLL